MVSSSPSQSSLSPAELVADRIADGRLFEARFLVKKFSPDIELKLRVQLQEKIDHSFRLFDQVFTSAEQLESEGRFSEAAVSYEQAAALVVDHPHLPRIRQRLENYRQLGAGNKKNTPANSGNIASGEKIATDCREVAEPEVPPVELSARTGGSTLILIGLGVGIVLFLSLGTFFYLINPRESVDRGTFIPVFDVHGEEKMQNSSGEPDSPFMEVIRGGRGGREEQVRENNVTVISSDEGNISVAIDIAKGEQKEIRGGKYSQLKLSPDSLSSGNMEIIEDTGTLDISLEGMDSSRWSGEKAGEGGKDRDTVKEKPGKFHVVKSGDTLEKISTEVYGDRHKWSYILDANREKLGEPPFTLHLGMELIVPPLGSSDDVTVINDDGTYTVQSGDTLGSIAIKVYGSSLKWQKLYELNRDRMSSPTALQVGQRLLVKESVADSKDKIKE